MYKLKRFVQKYMTFFSQKLYKVLLCSKSDKLELQEVKYQSIDYYRSIRFGQKHYLSHDQGSLPTVKYLSSVSETICINCWNFLVF